MEQARATETRSRTASSATRGSAPPTTLDQLADLSDAELSAIYARGAVPNRLDTLDGDLVGRMLAVRRTGDGAVFRALRAFAKGPRFPWAGKSFHATDAVSGTGINRIRLGGRHRLFPFRTYRGLSAVDGKPAVYIDYDDADNPGLIRSIHDEVREVAQGLFLGPACLKRPGGKRVVILWFALDARGMRRDARAS